MSHPQVYINRTTILSADSIVSCHYSMTRCTTSHIRAPAQSRIYSLGPPTTLSLRAEPTDTDTAGAMLVKHHKTRLIQQWTRERVEEHSSRDSGFGTEQGRAQNTTQARHVNATTHSHGRDNVHVTTINIDIKFWTSTITVTMAEDTMRLGLMLTSSPLIRTPATMGQPRYRHQRISTYIHLLCSALYKWRRKGTVNGHGRDRTGMPT